MSAIPYVVLTGTPVFWGSLLLSLGALFAVEAVVSVLTHRPPLVVGARQTMLGLAAAAVTYVIGSLLGASIA